MTTSPLKLLMTMRADLSSQELALLKGTVRSHYDSLVRLQRTSELVSVDLAELLCLRLELLLDQAPRASAAHRAAIVGAARYFVSEQDAVPDGSSLTGLDDDVLVFNTVAKEIGRMDLVIDA